MQGRRLEQQPEGTGQQHQRDGHHGHVAISRIARHRAHGHAYGKQHHQRLGQQIVGRHDRQRATTPNGGGQHQRTEIDAFPALRCARLVRAVEIGHEHQDAQQRRARQQGDPPGNDAMIKTLPAQPAQHDQRQETAKNRRNRLPKQLMQPVGAHLLGDEAFLLEPKSGAIH
ncbi:hypothetical protein D3C87_1366850 [compost metagenome]